MDLFRLTLGLLLFLSVNGGAAIASCSQALRAQSSGLLTYFESGQTGVLAEGIGRTKDIFKGTDGQPQDCLSLLTLVTSLSEKSVSIAAGLKVAAVGPADRAPLGASGIVEALEALVQLDAELAAVRKMVATAKGGEALRQLIEYLERWLKGHETRYSDRRLALSPGHTVFRVLTVFSDRVDVREYKRSEGLLSAADLSVSVRHPENLGKGTVYVPSVPASVFRDLSKRMATRGVAVEPGQYSLHFDAFSDRLHFEVIGAPAVDELDDAIADLIKDMTKVLPFTKVFPESTQQLKEAVAIPPVSQANDTPPSEVDKDAANLLATLIINGKPKGVCYYKPQEIGEELAKSMRVFSEPSMDGATLPSLAVGQQVFVLDVIRGRQSANASGRRVLYWAKINYVPKKQFSGAQIVAYFPLITERVANGGATKSGPRLDVASCG